MLRHGRNANIWINGTDISGDLNTITPNSEQELADVTVFGNLGHTMYPGLAKDSVTIEALYNDTEKGVFEGMIQVAPASTAYGAMIAFGSALGDPVYALDRTELKSNSIKGVVTDVNRATISLDTDNFPFESGVMLTAGKQTVAAGSTAQGTSVDNNSDSGTTGGAAYLQVFSVIGGTLTVSVRQSSTGAFAGEQTTTATFAAASTNITQRVAVTSQIYRYAQASWVGATSTSQFALALVRY